MLSQRVHVDRVFHALGDPTRRAIVEQLSDGPVSVSKLAEPFAITLAAVVQHLQVLEKSGLVRTQKRAGCALVTSRPRGSTWPNAGSPIGDRSGRNDSTVWENYWQSKIRIERWARYFSVRLVVRLKSWLLLGQSHIK